MGEGKGPRKPSRQRPVDAAEPRLLVSLEQRARVGRVRPLGLGSVAASHGASP